MEIWKDIKGFEGKYQISNYGQIKSLGRFVNDYRGGRFKREKILSLTDNGKGYYYIKLNKKNYYIHRLVAQHFIENPYNHKCINHKDFNKHNNIVDNLEWVSQKENVLYSVKNMRKPKSKCKTTNTGEKYIQKKKNGMYRVNMRFIKIDRNFKTFEEALNFKKEVVSGGKINND